MEKDRRDGFIVAGILVLLIAGFVLNAYCNIQKENVEKEEITLNINE